MSELIRHTISPTQPADPNSFCRLLPPSGVRFNCESLRQLALSMRSDPPKEKKSLPPFRQPPAAAYTYLGQFIDHDLIRDETPLALAGDKEPYATPNLAGGRLDLHHLYGDGPGSSRHGGLYESDEASFRLGLDFAASGATAQSQTFDLPLNDCGCPAAAEDRNTENMILRQICGLFMKLHNLAVSQGASYEEARKRTTETYHYIVCHDFLKNVLTTDVFRRVVAGKDHCIDWKSAGFAVPVEFAQAAFRFGHSMVRQDYQVNKEHIVPVSDIFGNPQKDGSLKPEMAIDWRTFADRTNRPSNKIDTRLVPELFALPSDQAPHCTLASPPAIPLPSELAVRTLWRGAATRLPTAQEMAQGMGIALLKPDVSNSDRDPWAKLAELDLLDSIPLWYYLLLEAEVFLEETDIENVFHNRLGPLGGQIVGEVILGSLSLEGSLTQPHDDSVVPIWDLSGTQFKVDSLPMVARVTGLSDS